MQYVPYRAGVVPFGFLQQRPVLRGLGAGGPVEYRAQQEQPLGAAYVAHEPGAFRRGFGGGEGAQGRGADGERGEGGRGFAHEAARPVTAAACRARAMCRMRAWRSAQYTEGKRNPSPAR